MKTWLTASMFGCSWPLPQTPQAPPRDTPAPAAWTPAASATCGAVIASGRASEAEYFELAELVRARGDVDRADTVVLAAKDAFPRSVQAQTAAAAVHNRRGDFDATIAALRAAAALQPESAEAQHRIAVFFWDKTRADAKLDPATKLSYIMQGLDAENQALRLQPDYAEAMTYKNILLRLQANLSTDPAEKAQLIAEADELRNRVIAAQRQSSVNQPESSEADLAPAAFRGSPEPFDDAMARLTPRYGSAGTFARQPRSGMCDRSTQLTRCECASRVW